MSVNIHLIEGRLGGDPELSYTASGTAVCKFSVATSESWNDKSGVKQESTEWHRVVVWDSQGEACAKYLKKGSAVFVSGKTETSEWVDKEGNNRSIVSTIANRVNFLGGKNDN